MTAITELKRNVEAIARKEDNTPLEIIGRLQSAIVAGCGGDDALLDLLCELKWEYVGPEFGGFDVMMDALGE